MKKIWFVIEKKGSIEKSELKPGIKKAWKTGADRLRPAGWKVKQTAGYEKSLP